MYDQIRQDTLFIILYSMVTATAVLASCYLLCQRRYAASTPAPVGCCLLCSLRFESLVVYADHFSLLKRGYQAV